MAADGAMRETKTSGSPGSHEALNMVSCIDQLKALVGQICLALNVEGGPDLHYLGTGGGEETE